MAVTAEKIAETLKSIQVTKEQAEVITEMIDLIGRYQDQLFKAEDLLMKTLKSTFVPRNDISKYFEEVKPIFNVDTDTF